VNTPHLAATDPVLNEPIYWFALLDRAIHSGDHSAAAEAQRQLDRLGVHVAYGRPRRPRRETACVS